MNKKFMMTTTQQFGLLLMVVGTSLAYAENIFRANFESGLQAPLYFVTTWQDDQDGNGYYDILANGSENTFPDIIANDVSSGNQTSPVIAVTANGNFVVVWEDDQDDNGFFQIWARGFYADGSENFSRITINSEGDGQQLNPDVAMSTNGDFVVVWEDDSDGNGRFNILGRGFFANGTPRFSDRPMALDGAGASVDPAIAMADDGSFVVTWADDENYNGFYQIKARGFHSNGTDRFSPFTVNSAGAGQQVQPDIAMTSDGDFVIAWADDQDGNWFYEVLARGFFANGTQRFSDITLNQVGTASQYRPAVGIADDGRFAATWVGQDHRILGRQFDASGNPVYDEIELNNNSEHLKNRPVVEVTKHNGYLVLWDQLNDSGRFVLKGRRIDNAGNQGSQFSVTNADSGDQFAPTVGVR